MAEKVLVLGSDGQVGSALMSILGDRAIGLTYPEIDLSKPQELRQSLEKISAHAIINAAAYTQVDTAEGERDLCFAVNATAPGIIAEHCELEHIPFVHFSTDYVFDGSGVLERKENDPTGPLSVYGESKLEGEKAVMKSAAKALIFRTSWVYDSTGKNFFNTMLRLGAERETLKIVSDQIGAPTYAPQLSQAAWTGLVAALRGTKFPRGIYHLTNSGDTSWFEFAQAIFTGAKNRGYPLKVSEVLPIPSSEYPTPAKRPLNSRLNCAKAAQVLGISLPHWKQGLVACFEAKVW